MANTYEAAIMCRCGEKCFSYFIPFNLHNYNVKSDYFYPNCTKEEIEARRDKTINPGIQTRLLEPGS